jgi:ribosomal protein S18 acetylase RimI-like enzyme
MPPMKMIECFGFGRLKYFYQMREGETMIVVKRMNQCTLAEVTLAWNRGFEGYFVPVTMTEESLLQRLGREEYAPSLSVVAFADGEPIGLVASGVRTINGKKVAWNGGTGIATAYRRQGVGRRLMEETLALYREAGVELATLEALRQNEKAIALYRQLGYEVTDRLLFWQRTDALADRPFGDVTSAPYRLRRGIPQEAASLSFYEADVPWQNQWPSLRDGEAVFVEDGYGETVGYAFYKRTLDESGKPTAIVLRQCAVLPGRADAEAIVRFVLAHVWAPLELACTRSTFNLPASRKLVVSVLEQAGFQPSGTEQVYMIRPMEQGG